MVSMVSYEMQPLSQIPVRKLGTDTANELRLRLLNGDSSVASTRWLRKKKETGLSSGLVRMRLGQGLLAQAVKPLRCRSRDGVRAGDGRRRRYIGPGTQDVILELKSADGRIPGNGDVRTCISDNQGRARV